MKIDNDTIAYLEDLSNLTLQGGEKQQIQTDLEKILSAMEHLKEINTDEIAERSHPFDNVNAFRDDEACPSFEREMILKNAPARNEEVFIAPKTVD